jgi:uncharacterized protein YdaL
MNKHLIALIIVAAALVCGVFAQVPTQEQCLQADSQLNHVYKQLRASLNDTQKQQLNCLSGHLV